MSSINTNVSAYYAQNNLRRAGDDAQASIARLSSGNRIIRASDDVAALSIGTILRTNVSTLKTALTNANQGTTLIQVADGALARLGEILQRQKALSVQANSGTLSDNERGYLNQEFQSLTEEYDRIVVKTNFNGVTLLDGALASSGNVKTQDPGTFTAVAREGESINTSYLTGGAAALTVATVGDSPDSFIGSLADAKVSLLDGTGTDLSTLTIQIGGKIFSSAVGAFTTDNAMTNLALTEITTGTAMVLNLDVADLGVATPNQAALNTIADALQTEIRKIDVYQTRAISKTDGDTGAIVDATTSSATTAGTILQGLDGDDFTLTSTGFSTTDGIAPSIGSFKVDYANGGAKISAVIDGKVYEKELSDLTGLKSANNGAANSVVLTSVDDDNSTFSISFAGLTGDITIDSTQVAKSLEDSLNKIFGSGSTGGASFQVGTESTDKIAISINSVKSNAVYKDAEGKSVTLDISTQAGAVEASDVLDRAIKTLTAARADVGALQSRFGYAAATIEVSIQNLDAARSTFLDADISEESTKFASAQVLQQAAISVLAQANQIPQNLLKLIG